MKRNNRPRTPACRQKPEEEQITDPKRQLKMLMDTCLDIEFAGYPEDKVVYLTKHGHVNSLLAVRLPKKGPEFEYMMWYVRGGHLADRKARGEAVGERIMHRMKGLQKKVKK